ncbi:MAG: Zn-ribbon domain-containing OB-fold protein [Actinomycetota bacterium]|nr:Zn-ribbon domain-containing OB-fold protein [Actinomycetota bacterium]
MEKKETIEGMKDEFYRFWSKKIGVPENKLRPFYDKEFDTEPLIDSPFEVPDKMEVFFKYSYGGQSRFFREIIKNKKLYGAKCPQCGKVFCPPRHACPKCYVDTTWIELSGKGTIEAFTVQYYSTSVFIKKVPFIVAYIRLDGTDFLMMAQMEMEDVNKAKPGMRVEAVFRDERHGTINDFYFRIIE